MKKSYSFLIDNKVNQRFSKMIKESLLREKI